MLYQIRKQRIAGTFKGRDRLVEGNFESINEAGKYLIDHAIELFGPNIGFKHEYNQFVLTDLTNNGEVVFKPGDTQIQDGDDLFEITAQSILPEIFSIPN